MYSKYEDAKEAWKNFESRVKSLNDSEKRLGYYDVSNRKNKTQSLSLAFLFYDGVIMNILIGNYEKANELSKLGEIYAAYALENDRREYLPGKKADAKTARVVQYYLLYKFKWINEKAEDIELLKNAFINVKELADERIKIKSPKAKKICMDVITTGLKLGEFETVKYYMDYCYKKKKDQVKEKTIIFDKQLFQYYIATYLSDVTKNSHLYELINESFKHYFEELLKRNLRLLIEYNIYEEQIDMAYIYYKYISDEDWSKVDPIKVIRSIRDGI